MKTFNFPVWLKGTTEEQKAEEGRQALARASYGRAHMTEAERLVGRGQLLERTARANLEAVVDDRRRWKARLPEESQRDETAIQVEDEKRRLSHALAMQGKYLEAAETHPDAERRAEYREIISAIEMPDDEKCGCPDTVAEVYQEDGKAKIREGEGLEHGGKQIRITPRVEEREIFSPVHGDVVSLVRCQKCKHLNARPLQSRLLKHEAAMTANQRQVVMNDLQVLGG